MELSELIKTPTVDNVSLKKPFRKAILGTLCVTGHHIMFSSVSSETDREEIMILHNSVDSLDRKIYGQRGQIMLKCKNFSRMLLDIPSAAECNNIADSIESLSNIDDLSLCYPFYHKPRFDILEDGWQAFPIDTEKQRMIGASEEWRLSNVNKDFSVCYSYPETLIVPKSIEDQVLIESAQFRQLNRFPVLSYYHKSTGKVILRSSQPLTGPINKRCREDERLLAACLGSSGRGYIVDTRQISQAKMATSKGGGVESESAYPLWRRIHQPIERHQFLHESLIKLVEACNDPTLGSDKWVSKLENTNWLANVKDILTCACFVAQCVDKDGCTVLVHGSEGIDSTLQVTSLAQLLLDHDCRTVRGFEALIEREWLQAGHPFQSRCAKSAYAYSRHKHEAPVFLLFLDSVWQVWQQFPCSFEFNEDFLIMLSEHAYSSQYGTFLCNNDKERTSFQLAKKTISLWSYVNRPEVIEGYMNPLYQPHNAVIWPSVAPQSLTLWSGLFLRFQQDRAPTRDVWEEVEKIKTRDKELMSQAVRLRRQLDLLEKEAIEAEVLLPAAPQIQNIPEISVQQHWE